MTNSKVAERLTCLRTENKLSQREMADIFGIKEGKYQPYENPNKPSFNSDLIWQIADYFNVSVDWILGRTDFRTDTSKFSKEQWDRINSSLEGKHPDIKYLKRKGN